MIPSHAFAQSYTLRDWDTDRWGNMQLPVMLRLAQDAAAGHCRLLGVDHDTLEKKDLFWAVTRHRFTVHRLPRRGEQVTVHTWPLPTTRVAYPRACEARDEHGEVLFRGISLWVLMQGSTRAMVLPGKSGITVEGASCGTELALPGSLLPRELPGEQQRRVCFTDLDRNGHMNNCRYLDWLADLLPSESWEERPVRELTLCYLTEAWEGQILTLRHGKTEENTFRLELQRREDGEDSHTRVFAAELRY